METARLHIMIVEDETAHADAIRRALEAAGMDAEILVAGTLQEYRAAVTAAAPNVALMDLNLPDGRAVEVLTSPPEAGPFPVLIMTSYGNERTVVEALKAGALDYVVKSPEAFAAMPNIIGRAMREWNLLQERKRSQEALRYQATLLNNISDAVITTDLDFTIQSWNGAAEALYGLRADEAIGTRMGQLVPTRFAGGELEAVTARFRADGVWRGEAIQTLKDGRDIYVLASVTLVRDETGHPIGVMAINRDITERKRAEEALRESEERFRTLVQQVPAVVYLSALDEAGTTLYISPQISTLLGYTPEEWTADAMLWQRCLHPDDRERVVAEYQRMRATGEPMRCEYRSVARDGRIVWVDEVAATRHDPDRQFPLHQGLLLDITERKQAEEALRESEERFRTLVQQVPAVVYLSELDEVGTTLYVSPHITPLLGYTPEEWVADAQMWKHCLHPDDIERVQAAYERMCATGEPMRCEYRSVARDGHTVWVNEVAAVRRDSEGQLALHQGLMLDITERKQAEEEREKLQAQLIQAQKMEAVGRLTAGVAHDFNNLLTVIMGFADLMKLQLVSADPLHEPLDKIISSGGTAAGLIQQLMAFSRQQVLQPQVLQVNAVLERMGSMLRRIIGEDVALEMAPAGDLWTVKVDPTQLQQVVVNLVVNAREAMPQGGRLRVETANVALDESQASAIVEARPGDYVTLRISDTGQGISPEAQAHIFEPFFTTKSQGTGLGLATVHGIVAQSGGFIYLQSAQGQGTTFTVYLPRASGEAEPVVARSPAAAAPRGTETILLVEDSAEVREYVGEVLRGQGYVVIEANCGREALRTAAEHAGPIHVLVTDVVMPDMSGRVAAQRLTEMRPDLKTLYISGYTDDMLETRGTPHQGTGFLQKPFSALDLAHRVRRILDGPLPPRG